MAKNRVLFSNIMSVMALRKKGLESDLYNNNALERFHSIAESYTQQQQKINNSVLNKPTKCLKCKVFF